MIPFIDLAAQQDRLRSEIEEGIARVLAHGQYILGPEVAELEDKLAAHCGAAHCVTVANGTDALQIALMALGVGPGDEVMGLIRQPDARLQMGGTFAPKPLEAEVRALAGWSRVDFHGWVGREDVREILSRVRAGLVLFHPMPNHVRAQPNKLFEYMAAGLPVIASDFPLWREIVEGAGCGLLVDPKDPQAIAEAMQWILDHPEEAAATRNLRGEGVPEARIVECGDVMFDAALRFAAKAEARGAGAAQLGLGRGEYVLATVHRQENTDDPVRLAAIMGGLALVAAELPVLLPLHPRTRARAEAANMADALAALHIVEPVGYLGMTGLEKDAAVIATDSGGVQKEAFFHGVPCVTLRDETEWVELVEAGWNSLIPPGDAGTIRDAILAARGTRGAEITPYGTGNAADIIAAEIAKALS